MPSDSVAVVAARPLNRMRPKSETGLGLYSVLLLNWGKKLTLPVHWSRILLWAAVELGSCAIMNANEHQIWYMCTCLHLLLGRRASSTIMNIKNIFKLSVVGCDITSLCYMKHTTTQWFYSGKKIYCKRKKEKHEKLFFGIGIDHDLNKKTKINPVP